jgi:hypothetical protein
MRVLCCACACGCRSGISGFLIFLCVALHAAAAYTAAFRLQRFLRTKSRSAGLVRTEFQSPGQRGAIAFLSLFWVWLTYLSYTHRFGFVTCPSVPF